MAGKDKASGKGKARQDLSVADTAEVTQAEMDALVEAAASINVADTETAVEDAETMAAIDDTAEVSEAEMARMVEIAASIEIDGDEVS